MRTGIVAALALSGLLLPAGRANALPVFAHRYGLSCQACHTTVPHLDAFGQAFLKNGFRMPGARSGVLPIAVKVNLAYSSDAEDGLPKAVVDEVELLTGGAIGTKFNYFVEQYAIDGGKPGLPRDAWLQYNSGQSHIRAGQFTLPLPVDPETQRDTESHYLAFDQTVGDNRFAFFDPRVGVDAYVDRGDASAHLVATQSSDRQSGNAPAGIDLMGSLSKTFGRTTFSAYRYQGQRSLGAARDAFYRQGFGAQYEFQKLMLTGVLQHGNDSDPGTGSAAASWASFLEGRYAFSGSLAAVARYDRSWDALSGSQHQTVLSLIARPARNMRFTIEDRIADHHTLNLGWLFAY